MLVLEPPGTVWFANAAEFKPAKKTCNLAMFLFGHSQLRLFKCSGLLYKQHLYIYLYTPLWFEYVGVLLKICLYTHHSIYCYMQPQWAWSILHNFLITLTHKLCCLYHGDTKQTAWRIQLGPVKHLQAVLPFSLISDAKQIL